MMNEPNLNFDTADSVINNPAPAEPVPVITDDILNLQDFLNRLDESGAKGRDAVMRLANEAGINLSYSSILRKLKVLKSNGVAALGRKAKSDKGELKSFSSEVLMKLQEIFCDRIRGGCAVRAYEDTHKYLRGISREFVVTQTGEVLEIHDGYLCDVHNRQILSQYSTKYVAGLYKLKPQNITGSACELSIGSYASAARFIKSVKINNADALFYNRFGLADFRNKRQHAMKLDYSDLNPNDLITGDGKLLDVLVISDDWRKLYRPWLVGWVNNATREYCYNLTYTETSESVANSLAVAVNKWGIPKIVCHDNGSGYRSGRFVQMKKHFGVRTRLATVKLARAKLVESIHNIIDNLLKTQIGYTGNKREEFPDDTRRRMKYVAGLQRDLKRIEKDFKESRSDENYVLTLANVPEARLKHSGNRFMHISELEKLLEEKFEEYHERVQGGLKKDKLGRKVYDVTCTDELVLEFKKDERLNTPNGRLEYKRRMGFVPVRADAAAVAVYAMNYELRTIQLTKGISLNNNEFYSPLLAKFAGERVLIRFTNFNSDKIYVFHSPELQRVGNDKRLVDGNLNASLKFVCIAERQDAIDYGDRTFVDKLLIQRAQERKLRDTFKENKLDSNIHTLTGIEKQLPAMEKAEEDFHLNKLPKFKKIKRLNDDD